MASHTIGVMSTPNAGGTLPLTNRRSGSVGHTAKLYGNSLSLAVGYHEITTRHSIAKEKRFRKGPSTMYKGWTQASTSLIVRVLMLSTAEVAMLASGTIICKSVPIRGDAAIVTGLFSVKLLDGATKAPQD
eukprot:819026_1